MWSPRTKTNKTVSCEAALTLTEVGSVDIAAVGIDVTSVVSLITLVNIWDRKRPTCQHIGDRKQPACQHQGQKTAHLSTSGPENGSIVNIWEKKRPHVTGTVSHIAPVNIWDRKLATKSYRYCPPRHICQH